MGSPGVLYGRPILYGIATTIFTPYGSFIEILAEGACTKAVNDLEIVAVANHNRDRLLGRQSSGTLTLSDLAVGVDSRIVLPDTATGIEAAVLVERGDWHGMSFAFSGLSVVDEWYEPTAASGGLPTCVIREIGKLLDVSVVTDPAYPTTSIRLERAQKLNPADRMREVKHHQHRRATARTVRISDTQSDRQRDLAYKTHRLKLTMNLGRRCSTPPKQREFFNRPKCVQPRSFV